MTTRYQVRLKNPAGAVVAIRDQWRVLEYNLKLNGVGSHSLELDGELDVVDLFELDGQLEIWRRDIAASPQIPWTLDYEGFHRTDARWTINTGESLYASRGRQYADFLARRIILYPPESSQAAKNAAAETVIKEYVDENGGPGATSPPRLLAAGTFAGLVIEVDAAGGLNWAGDRAYRNLLDVLQEIAAGANVDFGVVSTGPATFEFQAKAEPWGDDRTTVGLDPVTGLNGAGNPPVIFSLDRGNMQTPRYVLNREEEVNAAIVLGQGIAADRVVIQRIDAVAIADSPWNRREGEKMANQESTTAALQDAGDAMLDKLQGRETFTFATLQIPGLLYGRDYFFGDQVTARYKTIERNKQIVGVKIVVSEGEETIDIELGDVP